MNTQEMDAFARAYVDALYFADTGEDGQPSNTAELSQEAVASILTECQAFQTKAKPLLDAAEALGYAREQAGHDFWLTRNGHGAGFWARPELKPGRMGDQLSLIARTFAPITPYADDLGKIRFMAG